jgi:hypothetical protein
MYSIEYNHSRTVFESRTITVSQSFFAFSVRTSPVVFMSDGLTLAFV